MNYSINLVAGCAVVFFLMPIGVKEGHMSQIAWTGSSSLSVDGFYFPANTVALSSTEEKNAVKVTPGNQIKLIPDELTFENLVDTWQSECGASSSTREITTTDSYLKIIGMGKAALPFIFRELSSDEPDHWFAALRAITRENPVSSLERGNLKKMAGAWLSWAARNNYV